MAQMGGTGEAGDMGGFVGMFGDELAWLASVVDLAAILVLTVGAARFLARWIPTELTSASAEIRAARNDETRLELAGYVLLGLELFIVSDVIHTALTLEIASLAFLGLLVLVRFLIAHFTERERRELLERREREAT